MDRAGKNSGDHHNQSDMAGFQAILNAGWSRPLSHIQNGPDAKDTYLVINPKAAINTNTTLEISAVFNQHVRNSIEQRPAPENSSEYWNEKAQAKSLTNLFDEVRTGAMKSTALAAPSLNTVLVDLDDGEVVSSELLFGAKTSIRPEWNLSRSEYNQMKQMLFIHEAAHAALKLHEPGADFVAAVTLLRENPDSRKSVNLFADFRAIAVMARNIDHYGIECHDAVKYALSMPQEKLDAMTDSEMLNIARYFDDQNLANKNMPKMDSPEKQAQQYLKGTAIMLEMAESLLSTGATSPEEMAPVAIESMNLLIAQARNAAPENSPAHEILTKIQNSLDSVAATAITSSSQHPQSLNQQNENSQQIHIGQNGGF